MPTFSEAAWSDRERMAFAQGKPQVKVWLCCKELRELEQENCPAVQSLICTDTAKCLQLIRTPHPDISTE